MKNKAMQVLHDDNIIIICDQCPYVTSFYERAFHETKLIPYIITEYPAHLSCRLVLKLLYYMRMHEVALHTLPNSIAIGL